MATYRTDKINEQVREVLTEIFRSVKDPRVSRSFVSVTAADVSKDLSFAKIYYSVLTGNPDGVAEGIKSASGYIRGELASRLNLRVTPKLTFIKDDSTQKAMHIVSVIKESLKTDEENSNAGNSNQPNDE